MNKLVLSALAATVVVGTTNASEGDWAGLDSELSALTTSMVKDGPSVGGYLEASYDTDDGSGDSAFGVGRNRITVSGDNGGYGYHVNITGNSSEGDDAYVTFAMGGMNWTMGAFRAPTTGNHLVNEEDMHFSDRSALGGGGARTTGLMTSGSMDALGYWIHIGDAEDLSARVTYDVMSGDGINLSVAYSMDDAADSSWMEANISQGPFGISATTGDNTAGTEDDAMVLIATYDVNDAWAVGIRSTDEGGAADDTMDWAVTYTDGGARWTFQTNDDDDLTIGCLVGF